MTCVLGEIAPKLSIIDACLRVHDCFHEKNVGAVKKNLLVIEIMTENYNRKHRTRDPSTILIYNKRLLVRTQ